jgi:hypothetical protein
MSEHKKRKKYLQVFFNKQLKEDLDELFGKNSYVEISNLTYVRSKKSSMLSIKLYVSDPKKIEDMFPIGLELLVSRAWNVVGDKSNLIIQSSFDLSF